MVVFPESGEKLDLVVWLRGTGQCCKEAICAASDMDLESEDIVLKLDGMEIHDIETLEVQDVQDRATLTALVDAEAGQVKRAQKRQEIFDKVVDDIMMANHSCWESRDFVRQRRYCLVDAAQRDTQGRILSWDLSKKQLSALPDSFGSMQVCGNLSLRANLLSSLPETMSNIQVGGDLCLTDNNIISLPASFGRIQVGGNLYVDDWLIGWRGLGEHAQNEHTRRAQE